MRTLWQEVQLADSARRQRRAGQVMKFVVTTRNSAGTSVPPSQLSMPSAARLGAPSNTRPLSLNEIGSEFFDAPAMAMLGTMMDHGPMPMPWMDPVTENPAAGATEIWELHNFTEDAHPYPRPPGPVRGARPAADGRSGPPA